MSKVSTKGQVTIPEELRDEYRIERGMEVEWERHADGILLRPVPGDRKRLASERVRKMLGAATNKELSTDEIMALMRGDD
jgi:AbrB family looped-hinge helix DNA binding protein